MTQRSTTSFGKRILCGMGLAAVLASTGCQVEIGGQMHPSAFYLTDDVQFFAAGPEAPLSREAAANEAYRANELLQGQ